MAQNIPTSDAIDYDLEERRMPSSQKERIPDLDNHAGDGIFSPSSLRANFIPVAGHVKDLDGFAKSRYKGLFQETPLFSPVFAHLPSVKPDTLLGASEEKQALRRKLLRGSNVLIVQGGYSGKRFIYERLKELGVNVTIMDGPDSVWRAAAEEGLIQQFIELDFTNYDTCLERALDALVEEDAAFDAVTTYFENAVPLAARIARSLGVESNPPSACDRARSKSVTREVMKQAKLDVPKFHKILAPEDIKLACDAVGFPAVLKPSFGAASFGVFRVNSEEETRQMYDKIMRSLDDRSDPNVGTLWSQGTEMLLEEYYDGDEFDIDLLLSDGRVVYSMVSDNWACWEPWFQETGTNCPSLYPADRQREMRELAESTTLALGFMWGVFHVELKYTSRGPRMIEVNARMGGMSVKHANEVPWGVDLVEEHVMSALRVPVQPLLPPKPRACFCQTAINTPYSGRVNSDTWLDHLLQDPRCTFVGYLKHKGEAVKGPETQVPSWLAELRFESHDPDMGKLLEFVRESILSVAPPIDADEPSLDAVKRNRLFFPTEAFPFRAASV